MNIELIGKAFRVILVALSLVAIAVVGLYPLQNNAPASDPEPLWEEVATPEPVEPSASAEEPKAVEPESLAIVPAIRGEGPVVGSIEAYRAAEVEELEPREENSIGEDKVEEQRESSDSAKTMSPDESEKPKPSAPSPTTPDNSQATTPPAPVPPRKGTPSASNPKPSAAAKPAPKAPQKSEHYNNKTTIHARTDVATTVRSVKGVGTIPIVITLDPKSTAPALPTYVLVSCTDRLNPYSGGYNTIGGQTTVKHLPYSGDCVVKVRSAYPTKNWEGQYNAIHVSTGTPMPSKADGEPYTGRAQWTSRPVSSSSDFSMSAPAGFQGSVVMKVTACSTRGGATDKTASFACDGHVNRTHSKGRIEVLNGGKVVATQPFNIELNKHHETFTIPVKLSAPDVTIRVVKTSGASILVHGPGSSIVGVH